MKTKCPEKKKIVNQSKIKVNFELGSFVNPEYVIRIVDY